MCARDQLRRPQTPSPSHLYRTPSWDSMRSPCRMYFSRFWDRAAFRRIVIQWDTFPAPICGVCHLAIGSLFIQINESAAVYANIQGLARSPEIRQNSQGESQMATAANSAGDGCNTSLTARFIVIVMPKH